MGAPRTMGVDSIYVIKKPVLTEKSTEAMNEFGRYTFEVDRRATKTDVKEAVEKLYGVEVVGGTPTCNSFARSRSLAMM